VQYHMDVISQEKKKWPGEVKLATARFMLR
jgi:hypothetical protein